MGDTTTGLACALATGLLVAAVAPAYADSGHGHQGHGHQGHGHQGGGLRLSFDRLDRTGTPVLHAAGSSEVVGAIAAAAGGQVSAGPGLTGRGHSLRFERFRAAEDARAAVVVLRPRAGAPDPTDPGWQDFSFGADFVLDEQHGVSATDNGDNLVQRGLVGSGPQYKIQLDGGVPSCRVQGSAGAVNVVATDAVETEERYRVRCRRVGDRVTLRVVSGLGTSPEVREYAATGATGDLSYGSDDPPFAIGGKVDAAGEVLAEDSDQFNGLVDDVVFRRLS